MLYFWYILLYFAILLYLLYCWSLQYLHYGLCVWCQGASRLWARQKLPQAPMHILYRCTSRSSATLAALSHAPKHSCFGVLQFLRKNINFHWHILNYVSTCVELLKIISVYDTMFDFDVNIYNFGCLYFSRYCGLERLSQKQILYIMFPTKCQVQNDRTNQ